MMQKLLTNYQIIAMKLFRHVIHNINTESILFKYQSDYIYSQY